VFGAGAVEQLAPLVAGYGKRAFLVLGSKADRHAASLAAIDSRGVAGTVHNIAGEPTVEMAQAAVAAAREAKSDVVVAIGGGSVLDTGKVVAAMLKNSGELPDYLEVVGKGKPLREQPAPLIAVPTTAGTGAEVTSNAVLGVPDQQVKVSMRSPLLLPRWAIVDPVLTYSMSPELTASTGLDALTQLVEAFVSNQANPLTDGICREGLLRAGRSLRQAFQDGADAQAREDMSIASLFSGLALANAKLGAAHGFAGPLGAMTSAPHGVICGKLLPYVIQANVLALQNLVAAGGEQEEASSLLARFDELGRILTGSSAATASDAVFWVGDLCVNVGLSGLRKYGLSSADFPLVVEKAAKASSMQGNPVTLGKEELTGILEKAIE
jgi:alcohol dehydrogenase class IV